MAVRIAIVITELDTGGAERCATELAIFLARRGHEVRVLALGPPPVAPRDELVQRLVSAGIEARFGGAIGSLHARRAVRWLRKQLSEFSPDVVQSILWHANVCSAVAMMGTSARLIGGMRVSEPRRWRWPLERMAARRMERVVCVSEDVKRHAEKRQRMPAKKLTVIPNGIDIPEIPIESKHQAEGHSIVFVGRLEPQKGIAPLIERLPKLLEKMPAWKLTIVGSGSLQSRLMASVQTVGLTDRIHFAGWQPQAVGWMSKSQIVILPAIYEGMPNVLLEAMSVGRPFVAFAVDGVAQLLADGYPSTLAEAQLVGPGDWHQFIAQVRALADNPSLRSECGLANQAHVNSHFRLSDQLAKYEKIYLLTELPITGYS